MKQRNWRYVLTMRSIGWTANTLIFAASFLLAEIIARNAVGNDLTDVIGMVLGTLSATRFSWLIPPLIISHLLIGYYYWRCLVRMGVPMDRPPKTFSTFSKVVVFSFFEELVFRGTLLLLFWLYGWRVALAALPCQAILWGASHLTEGEIHDNLIIFRATLFERLVMNPIVGVIYGLITMLSGGILIAYLLHLMYNTHWMYRFKVFNVIDRKISRSPTGVPS